MNLLVVSLVFKAGVYTWEGEVEASLPGNESADEQDGTDAMFAVGVDLPIVPIRIEAERYDLEDNAVDVVSANLVFQF